MLARYRFKDYKSHNGALVCVTRLESECVIYLGGQFPASDTFYRKKSSPDLFKSNKCNKLLHKTPVWFNSSLSQLDHLHHRSESKGLFITLAVQPSPVW